MRTNPEIAACELFTRPSPLKPITGVEARQGSRELNRQWYERGVTKCY